MAELFTRRERIVMWILVGCLALMATLRFLHARRIIGVFRAGEVLRRDERK